MHSALGDPWQLHAVVRQSDLRLDLLARQAVSAFVVKRLAWPLVELARHGIQLGLRDVRQVDTLREVLPQ